MWKLTNLSSLMLALCCASAIGADRPSDTTPTMPAAVARTPPPADNTSVNVRDKSGTTQTPQKQTNRAEDRKLLAAVRRTVVRDKSLSTAAHNIKMVVKDGVVTLRGPVRSEDEKAKIEKLAQQVAGAVVPVLELMTDAIHTLRRGIEAIGPTGQKAFAAALVGVVLLSSAMSVLSLAAAVFVVAFSPILIVFFGASAACSRLDPWA